MTSNSADSGGGTYDSTLTNCTLTANSAGLGGGSCYGTLNNSIVYFNSALNGPNHYSATFNRSCSTPLPPGPGNIEADPLLASSSHLSAQSPCRGKGSSGYTSGVDIDGETWLNPPCMGADQYTAGQTTGTLTLSITAASTNITAGVSVSFTGHSAGRITGSAWDFGDGVVVSNCACVSHAWSAPGLYPVRLTGYNDSWPGGISTTVLVEVAAMAVHYVNGSNNTPVYPYTNWTEAALTIQEAIDAGTQRGRLIMVAQGVYRSGGRAVYGQMTNRVAVSEWVEVRSVNGPEVTSIEGCATTDTTNSHGNIRCVYVGKNAVLNGFTLTNGHTRASGDLVKEQSGGGAWCELTGVLTNCILAGNSAQYGGGAYWGTLSKCTLRGNSAYWGGGASGAALDCCTLTSNSATSGGGVTGGALNNCTVKGNSANSGGGVFNGTLRDCSLRDNWATSDGGGAAYSRLYNCDLTDNSAGGRGGGALDESYEVTLNNCTLTGNSASQGGGTYGCRLANSTLSGNTAKGNGGGAYGGALQNCTLSDNRANRDGGGVYNGTLQNCALTGNSAITNGGGGCNARFNNCIVYFNSAPNGPNHYSSTLDYSCTTPLPPGPGNITNAPLFVATNGWSNPRLQPDSPCINAGFNGYAPSETDLDGSPRIVGGTVDIGAYECQSPVLLAYFDWMQSYNLSTMASLVHMDTDGDGLNNWQEWRADTSPTNALSRLAMLSPTNAPTGMAVTWQSVPTRSYFLERGTNVAGPPPSFTPVATGIPGQPSTTTFTDTTATNGGPFFYRVGVQE